MSWNWRAAWSYVTGGHSAKLGYQGTQMKYDWVNYTNPSLMRYTFNGGVPTAVNYRCRTQWENANRAVAHSIFLQDQWTRGRMTLQGALRYDHVDELGAGRRQRHRSDHPCSIRRPSVSSAR